MITEQENQIDIYTKRLNNLKVNRDKCSECLSEEEGRSYDELIRTNAEFIHVLKKQAKCYSEEEVMNALHKAELEHNKNYNQIWLIMKQHLKHENK